MEETYPRISASVAAGILSFIVTVVQIVFLAISFLPGVSDAGTDWMNVAMMLVTPLATVPIMAYRVTYARRRVDSPAMVIGWADRWGW